MSSLSNTNQERDSPLSRIPNTETFGQFLHCRLAADTNILLPVEQITEVLTIPLDKITPMAHLPSWVMGVFNWRGEVLWVVDLSHLVGLPPWHQQATRSPNHSAVVLRNTGTPNRSASNEHLHVGFVVTQVREMEEVQYDSIKSLPTSTMSDGITPYLRGYWLKPNGDIFTCLDVDSLFAAMP